MYNFFAVINRMRFINRWVLMRNVKTENIQEHSHHTAVLAHALAVIDNERCGANVNPERAAVLALFHDAPEVVTGDMPTPVKYHSPDLREGYAKIEEAAKKIMLRRLPPYLLDTYDKIFNGESEPEWAYVKMADTLSAYIKCVEELDAGNKEFSIAHNSLLKKLQSNDRRCLKIFMEEFLEAYTKTIDEQQD